MPSFDPNEHSMQMVPISALEALEHELETKLLEFEKQKQRVSILIFSYPSNLQARCCQLLVRAARHESFRVVGRQDRISSNFLQLVRRNMTN